MSSTSKLERLRKKILNLQPTKEQVEEAELVEVGSYYWLWDEDALDEMTIDELEDIINCLDD